LPPTGTDRSISSPTLVFYRLPDPLSPPPSLPPCYDKVLPCFRWVSTRQANPPSSPRHVWVSFSPPPPHVVLAIVPPRQKKGVALWQPNKRGPFFLAVEKTCSPGFFPNAPIRPLLSGQFLILRWCVAFPSPPPFSLKDLEALLRDL